MQKLSRRDLLKTSVAASGLGAAGAGAQVKTAAEPSAGAASPMKSPRERLLLDFGWRFHLGHADDPARDFGFGANAETFAKSGGFVAPGAPNFDDSAWREIDLPHDWAVELPFENSRELTSHGFKPLGRKFPATSIGWYRRVFDLPAEDVGKRLAIDFDGVFRDAMVVFNGHYMGRNMSGYAPFRFDVTDFANYGARNVLVVRVDATLNEGWFYEGAGIYRHVWLTKTNPVHVAHWGTFVRSEVGPNAAVVRISTEVRNDSDSNARACRVTSIVVDQTQKELARVRSDAADIAAWGGHTFDHAVQVSNPSLWSPDHPHRYRVLTTVVSGNDVTDQYETPFGIRTLRFDADKGFFLNGEPLKIKGTCNHQDHAGVGAALPDRIQYFRIEKLKEMGANAYRTSHNPPTPELLDACDEIGMLVMDETRMMSSNPEGLSQIERLVLRDRNHPSVFIWSLGNEEREQGTERGKRMVTTMKRLARRLDPTRPVTVAMNRDWGKGVSEVVDVQGFNYNEKLIDEFHRNFPKQPTVGTETGSTVCTRGIYENDKQKGYVSAYDLNFPPWAATAETWWKVYDERPFLAGGFAWTGFDYRGEPTPYRWPCINSHFGILDTCGFSKDNFYYYKAWWGSQPVLHLFPHWNWAGKEGQEIDVWCHTNVDRVELFLNGETQGARDVARNAHVAWKVKFAPGTLEARGFKGGKQVLTAKRETTGAPARIVLRPNRKRMAADGEDVAMIAVEVVDSQGRLAPGADNEITFAIKGAGRLIGVGNGDPSSHEPDKASKRRVFNGLAMAIVQSLKQAGDLVIEATSPGLESASATVTCESVRPRPAV
jgi:beta-galactosidase